MNVFTYLKDLGRDWEQIKKMYIVRKPIRIEKLIRFAQPGKKRGIGFTRRNKSKSKAARKQEYKSRLINRRNGSNRR